MVKRVFQALVTVWTFSLVLAPASWAQSFHVLELAVAGTAGGTVSSNPPGINCPPTANTPTQGAPSSLSRPRPSRAPSLRAGVVEGVVARALAR